MIGHPALCSGPGLVQSRSREKKLLQLAVPSHLTSSAHQSAQRGVDYCQMSGDQVSSITSPGHLTSGLYMGSLGNITARKTSGDASTRHVSCRIPTKKLEPFIFMLQDVLGCGQSWKSKTPGTS